MITTSFERLLQALEDGLAVVLDLGRLSVKKLGRANHAPAEHLADGLMTQTYTQNWDLTGTMLDDLHGNACAVGHARPWGNHDSARTKLRPNLIDGDLVVAAHLNLRAQLSEIL